MTEHLNTKDTIIAIATAAGRGGVGVVRASGDLPTITILMQAICGRSLTPRHATYGAFLDADHHPIDHGIALYFNAPHSYTGEHVLELQGHGGPVVMQLLLRRCLQVGTHLNTPYLGYELPAEVWTTVVNGHIVYAQG